MIVFGGIYKANSKIQRYLPKYFNVWNDQKQNFWFPIRVKNDKVDCIYMVDTYQFDMKYKYQQDYNLMVEYLKSLGKEEDNSWLAGRVYDYYYSARVIVNEETIEAFELLANLEEWEIVSETEARYYNAEDILYNVMFWNFHRSGRGVTLKRKDAKLNFSFKVNYLYLDVLNGIAPPYISGLDVKKLLDCEKEAMNKNAEYDKEKIEYIVKLEKYIKRIRKNYLIYKEKIKGE